MTKFDVIEMIGNLQADINQIILTTTLNASTSTTKEENANTIQQQINATIKSYYKYVHNKKN